ncbi:hypothetical protein LNP17_02655 [Klebsiella variicola subsp. variicola]|nr:hypothetical protein [Klebsiella variicola subsp. variicola]
MLGKPSARRWPSVTPISEVIAINDGSSDNTAQVLQQLAQEGAEAAGDPPCRQSGKR